MLFVSFGARLMGTLYDERYHESGAMLELLAPDSLIGCVYVSYTGILLPMGRFATTSDEAWKVRSTETRNP